MNPIHSFAMYKKNHPVYCCLIAVCSFFLLYSCNQPEAPRRLEILFLGHDSKHHESEKLADILLAEYFKAGINISYTTNPDDLNEENLAYYDGLILYANHDSITAPQEKALLDFVQNGKGFIPLHCASYCFRNSKEVVELIGGQFKTHGQDSFAATIVKPDHPVMKDVPAFITFDETYVHDKISKDIEVLSERVEGDHREPYTWVRSFGKGRVFYTAYGHDERTFRNPGFLKLVQNGILWAVGEKAQERLKAFTIADPSYQDGPVPNYEKKDPAPKVQESLSPEASMSLMQVPVGFTLELFAAEPMVVNPIYINWDEKGRLWVIETVDYPNEIKEEDQGDDRIKILEDTDGDGKADKATIFADKLNIPTSFVFVNGGVLVSQAPSFIFLKDTNGDDQADIRQPLLKGWGKQDTHAQASNLRYGLDNQIWGVVGYSGFDGEINQDSIRFGMGLYRFSPDGKEFEYLSSTSNNTWGLGFSEEFDVFISTANNTHSGFFGMPVRYPEKLGIRETGVEKIDGHYGMHVATKNLRQVDVHGGFTAAAGHSLYTARDFPKEYWNRVAFVNEPTGRLVHKQVLVPKGAGFAEGKDGWNMLVSADDWAAPIQSEVGPDGALWITDWYDFIIQHNPTPNKESAGLDAENGEGNAYINPLRDHERGRIYRLKWNKSSHKHNLELNTKDTDGLIKALTHPNMFWRTTAQRLLVENADKKAVPGLIQLIEKSKADEVGVNAPAIHALWTLHGLQALNGTDRAAMQVALNALKNNSAGVRRAAIQVLPKDAATFAAMSNAKLFMDPDLRVRLAAVLAITDMAPSPAIATELTEMASKTENQEDPWLKKALSIAGTLHAEMVLPALSSRGADTGSVIWKTLIQKAVPKEVMVPGKQTAVGSSNTIVLRVVKDVMKFDKEMLTAKAGTTIKLVLQNPDFMQHNFVLIQPDATEKVGAAADELAKIGDGSKLAYVPQLPEVLAATPLVNPGGSYTLTIKLPDLPGDYPYLCTFPGHWRIMKGILRVTR